jgi:hypothetical protein
MILREDDYTILSGSAQAQKGDVVVYRKDGEVAHVGIVIDVDEPLTSRKISVLSKWGAFGEYVHPIDEVPVFFGRAEEFWTDRRSENDL